MGRTKVQYALNKTDVQRVWKHFKSNLPSLTVWCKCHQCATQDWLCHHMKVTPITVTDVNSTLA